MKVMIRVEFNNGENMNYFEVENFKMNADTKLASFECKDIISGEGKIFTKKILINLNNVIFMETVNMDEV